jgi:transcriptional regulator with XRE-family HTH domain
VSRANYAFSLIFKSMGFKENLKSQLLYSDMLVKELSALSGVNKHALDNYLNTHNSIPLADTAVKIAKALGVSVEYLVTGQDPACHDQMFLRLTPEAKLIAQIADQLNKKDRAIVLELAKMLKKRAEPETKN